MGPLLGPCWALVGLLGRSWALSGRSWDVLGTFWAAPGPLLGRSSAGRSARKSGLRCARTSASIRSPCVTSPQRAAAVRSTLNLNQNIDFILAIFLIVSSSVGAAIASRVIDRFDQENLKVLFGILLITIASFLLYDLFKTPINLYEINYV